MKKILIVIACTILISTVVVCGCSVSLPFDNLVLKVDCPKSYSIGELIILDATGSKIKDLEWVIFPNTANFSVNGKRAYFSSPNQETYTVVLCGTDGKEIDCLVITLKGKKAIKIDKINKVTDPYATKLESWLPKKYSQLNAYKLAQSFRSISSISKESFNDVEAMLLATAYSNKVALADNLSIWKPFLDNLTKEVEVNPPTSVANCAEKWLLIANTLEKVAK